MSTCPGFFDGCFVCLLGPIVYDIVGPQNASHGIGFLLGLLSIPMITGPPLAGNVAKKRAAFVGNANVYV